MVVSLARHKSFVFGVAICARVDAGQHTEKCCLGPGHSARLSPRVRMFLWWSKKKEEKEEKDPKEAIEEESNFEDVKFKFG